jgi:histidyl-tRNA synthetase
MMAAEAAGELKAADSLGAYVVWMGDAALEPARQLTRDLRRGGVSVEIGYEPVKLKKSMGLANRYQARYAIIIGESELSRGRYQVKDMTSGEQQEMEPGTIAAYLKEKL